MKAAPNTIETPSNIHIVFGMCALSKSHANKPTVIPLSTSIIDNRIKKLWCWLYHSSAEIITGHQPMIIPAARPRTSNPGNTINATAATSHMPVKTFRCFMFLANAGDILCAQQGASPCAPFRCQVIVLYPRSSIMMSGRKITSPSLRGRITSLLSRHPRPKILCARRKRRTCLNRFSLTSGSVN